MSFRMFLLPSALHALASITTHDGKQMQIATRVTWFLSLVGAAALGVLITELVAFKAKEIPLPVAPLISLEKMGHLASLKVNYADVIEFTEKRTQDIPWTQWELRFGGTKVLLVARGDCTVATDLRAAKYENVNLQDKTLTLILRTPKLLIARVNHKARDKGGSYFYAITSQGIEPIIPDSSNRLKAVNNALIVAQREVERACHQADIVATAKRNAEEVLRPTFLALGWKANVVWQP